MVAASRPEFDLGNDRDSRAVGEDHLRAIVAVKANGPDRLVGCACASHPDQELDLLTALGLGYRTTVNAGRTQVRQAAGDYRCNDHPRQPGEPEDAASHSTLNAWPLLRISLASAFSAPCAESA